MNLQQRINDDLKSAMKARDRDRLSTLRMLLSALKNEAIEHGRGPQGALSDDEVLVVLAREKKKRDEAAASFADAGRDEQAAKEQAEADHISEYLPAQLADEELRAEVDAAIAEVGASSMADMGPTMKAAMARVGGRADGARVSALVRARLQG